MATHPVLQGSSDLIRASFACYDSADEWVQLRTSNAFKRVFRACPDYFADYIDRFIALMARLEQPSAQWTFCDLMRENASMLSAAQKKQATAIMARLLQRSDDWIVLNSVMKTFCRAAFDPQALTRAQARLQKLQNDSRSSVAKNATRTLALLPRA